MTKSLRLYFLFLITLLVPLSLFGEIYECEDLTEALSYIEEDTCVFYEVDNVLVKGTSVVSRVAFLNLLKEDLLREGYTCDQIAKKIYPQWSNIIKKAEMMPISEKVYTFLDTLKKEQIPSFALTHRGPKLAYTTVDQLERLGINSEKNQVIDSNLVLEKGKTIFYEGMVFVHPCKSKADSLVQFLDRVDLKYNKIVCIDHELIHLVEIGNALAERGIEFCGIYLKDHQDVLTDWDIQIGKLQFDQIDKILPDRYAIAVVAEAEE